MKLFIARNAANQLGYYTQWVGEAGAHSFEVLISELTVLFIHNDGPGLSLPPGVAGKFVKWNDAGTALVNTDAPASVPAYDAVGAVVVRAAFYPGSGSTFAENIETPVSGRPGTWRIMAGINQNGIGIAGYYFQITTYLRIR